MHGKQGYWRGCGDGGEWGGRWRDDVRGTSAGDLSCTKLRDTAGCWG